MSEEIEELQKAQTTKEQIAVEKQKQKTERIKQGRSKIGSRTLCACIFLVLLAVIATWFISIFMPECVKVAIEIFKNIT